MKKAGLAVHEDAATNLIGIRPGRSGRILMTGSHLDSVKEAGHLDGAYGVVAAIEVADAAQREGTSTSSTPWSSWALATKKGAMGLKP